MTTIKYKYQNYNTHYLFADAIISQYITSAKCLKEKQTPGMTDIAFCHSFERTVRRLLKDHSDKSELWLYILSNEFPHKAKTYIKKHDELSSLGLPVSRPSYYREVVLFTNLVAEYFGLGDNYVKTKEEACAIQAPTSDDVFNYVLAYNIE